MVSLPMGLGQGAHAMWAEAEMCIRKTTNTMINFVEHVMRYRWPHQGRSNLHPLHPHLVLNLGLLSLILTKLL